jgi:hypothetical protein
MVRKNLIVVFLILVVLHLKTTAQNLDTTHVVKGDYEILKLDVLSLMGLGIQKIHASYEISALNSGKDHLPTLNFNLNIPLSSTSEDLNIRYGAEIGGELRFYQLKRHQNIHIAEGAFIGMGIDGGAVKFDRNETFYNSNIGAYKESNVVYNRVRTGIYFLIGGASKIGENLYFESSLGLGWNNVNVKAVNNQAVDGYQLQQSNDNILYLNFREGKGQRFYMPLNVSFGYNLGNR